MISATWNSAGICPPAMAKPPRTDPATTTRPMMGNIHGLRADLESQEPATRRRCPGVSDAGAGT